MGQIIPVGEWTPDAPDFGNTGSAMVSNVVPRSASSYGPMSSLVPYSNALSARS